MSRDTANLYEGMYVISSKLGDHARQDALNKVLNGITSRGGEVKKVFEQGRRRLAYEINGHREGIYYVVYFMVKPSAINELWQEYHLHEDLVRFITLRTEKVPEKIEFKPLEEPQ